MSELNLLIANQTKDDDLRVVKGDGRSFPMDPLKLVDIADSLQKVASHEISWGEPAQIVQAKRDKACPICGRRKNEKDYEPFDLAEFGARCPNSTVSRSYVVVQDFTF